MDDKELQGIKALAGKVNDVPPKKALAIVSEETLITRAETKEGFKIIDSKIQMVKWQNAGIIFVLTLLVIPVYLILFKNYLESKRPDKSARKRDKNNPE